MTDEIPASRDRPAVSAGEEAHLTARQQELMDELGMVDRNLGGLYVEGIRLLRRIEEPGVVLLFGHVGRELLRGVVEVHADEGISDLELAEIPENEEYRKRIARSLSLKPSDPRVSQWFDLYNQFVSFTHHRPMAAGSRPKLEKLHLAFERLEQLLYGRIGPYFQTQAQLDELLTVTEPTETDVARLQTLLLRPQQRRYFFGELAHIGWLEALDRGGTFSNPPGRREFSDGSWQAVRWPEGEFLTRVATDAAEKVVAILERLPSGISNPAVWQVVADVANTVRPELGRQLVPALVRATKALATVPIASELLKLTAKLADSGDEQAFELADSLLEVPSAGDLAGVSHYRSDWLFPRLAWAGFSEFAETVLPTLERGDSERSATLMVAKLRQVVAVLRELNQTHLLRSRFRSDDDIAPDDVASQLINAVSGALGRFASIDSVKAQRALEMASSHTSEAFSGLRLRVLAAAGQHLQAELDEVLTSKLALQPGGLGREVALVLRTQFDNASEAARQLFRYGIERGPGTERIQSLLEFQEIKSPTLDDIEEAKRIWQRRRLQWFRGEIPRDLEGVANDVGAWGKVPSIEDQELAEVGFYSGPMGSWVEPRNYTASEFGDESADLLVKRILEWRPAETPSKFERAEDLHLSVREFAERDPAKAIEVWRLASEELPAGFATSILEGLRSGLQNDGSRVDWEDAIAFVREAVERCGITEASPSPTRQAALFRAAIDFLQEGVNSDLIPANLEAEVWQLLAMSVVQPVAWSDDGEPYESLVGLIGVTLNRTGSRLIRTTIVAGLWSYRMREKDDDEVAGRVSEEKLAPILDHVLHLSGTDRVTSESILGQFLPQLQLLAPRWLKDHTSDLLENGAKDVLGRPAWATYLTQSHVYNNVFDQLRPWYVIASRETPVDEDSEDEEWSVSRALARHVMVAYLRGLVSLGDPDELVESTFATVPSLALSRVYWAVFRDLSDSEHPPTEEWITRLLELWEWRLERLESTSDQPEAIKEACGLGWLLRAPYLPDTEAIRLGARTVRAARGSLELHADWERFRELAAVDADAVFEMVALVIDAQLSETHHFIGVDQVMDVLRGVLEHGTVDTQARARRLVHRLGEAGYDDFRELLETPDSTPPRA